MREQRFEISGQTDAELLLSKTSSTSHRERILIVEDDACTRETLGLALRLSGYDTLSAGSADEGIPLAIASDCSLIVIDLCLGDSLGTDVMRTLRNRGNHVPFVLISGFLTIPIAVEATKLGAVDVLEKPLDIDLLTTCITTALSSPRPPTARSSTESGSHTRKDSPSVGERWAQYVLKGADSDVDLKTLSTWARHVAVSYASLCETCRLAGVRPHDARDFCRILRALIRSHETGCRPEALLDVSDRRTLRTLIERSGVGCSRSVEDFLNRQCFIDHHSGGFVALLNRLHLQSLAKR